MKFDAKDWPVISALLDEALELPRERLAAWLDELPEAQGNHRPVLMQLLQAHARVQTQDFLHALPRLDLGVEAADGAMAPAAIGPYRLLREIGRGGMGSVWLAERSDGLLKRQVALKLPHPGLATRAFAERLARERDILASLAHPHIARLYDAGISAQGQPYVALAYVQGHSLIEHCQARGLGVRERIALFLQVLQAVQYAHAHLVIHRDLKPSNVLVDEQGSVHLLDFGIAKLLVDGLAQATELTLDGGAALTPDYASPEQAVGGAVTTASDIYSLGVLLYELLAGDRPYRLPALAPAALAQAVRDADVAAPSTVARRGGDPARARALRGDLDTIVQKALKKDAAERYATADAFAQDLQRHLDGQAVLARPDGGWYRAGKFVRRHRAGMAVTLALVMALAAGLAGTVWEARQARQQAARAQAVQDFLIGLFNESDPARAQGRELTAREMLDRGQRELGTRLASEPALQGLLDGVLVDLYLKLGDEAKALPLAEARLALALKMHGPASIDHGDALYALARVHGSAGHGELAYQTYRRAYEVLAAFPAERADELLLIEGHIATELGMLDRSQEAAQQLQALLPQLQAHFGPRSWELLRHQTLLAGFWSDLGEHAKAAPLIAQIVPQLDAADPAHALDAAELRVNLGYALWNARRTQQALALLTRTVADADRLLGWANSLSVTAQRTLGLAYNAQGQFDLAARTFDDATERALRLYGENHAMTRFSESFDVLSLVMTGQTQRAVALAQRSLRDAAQVAGLSPAIVRGFNRRQGLALLLNGDAEPAAQVLGQVLAQEQQAGLTRGGAHGTTLLYLAGARAQQGDDAAAAATARQAVDSFGSDVDGARGAEHAELTEALARARLGQAAAAQQLVEQAQRRVQQLDPPSVTDPLFVDLVRAELLRHAGHAAEAERLDHAARERLKALGGAQLPRRLPMIL